MDNRKDTVHKAIARLGPDRIPLLYAYSLEKSDVVNIPVVNHFTGDNKDRSEWGFEWERIDNALLMGQPRHPVLEKWSELKDFIPPIAAKKDRFDLARETMDKLGPDRFYKANFSLSGFAILTMLRGFENIMLDICLERDFFEELCDIVYGFENEVIRLASENNFSAIGLADDWGSQSSLFISPALWREVFKPRYKAQIELAHNLGLKVYLHSCGYIIDIIEDLIEIGLDVINPGQPDINGIKELGKRFGGRICFACAVSYQTTGIAGSQNDIKTQIAEYVDCFGAGGGLIGIIPEDSQALGIDKEKLDLMASEFHSY